MTRASGNLTTLQAPADPGSLRLLAARQGRRARPSPDPASLAHSGANCVSAPANSVVVSSIAAPVGVAVRSLLRYYCGMEI